MKLINTDGMAFIGPGSEWFWTAISGIVLAVTFIAIYRQLRLQRSQAAIEQVESISRDWHSERWARIRLECLISYREIADPAELETAAANLIIEYWEKVATLARGGHIDWRLVLQLEAAGCEEWWLMLGPSIRKYRATVGDTEAYQNFEWLADASAERTRRSRGAAVSEATVKADVDFRIAMNRDLIRMEQSLRSVSISSNDPEMAASPATVVTAQG